MGLFKFLGRTVGRVAEKLGEVTRWRGLENAGLDLQIMCAKEFKNVSRKIAEQGSYDEDCASIEQTNRMNEILSEFSINLEKKADTLEKDIIKASSIYFDELIDDLDKSKDKNRLNINIDKIKKNKKRIEEKIEGSFKKHLSKRISLDDDECLSILKLKSGINKDNKMRHFGHRVLKEALDNLSSDIQKSMLEQQEYIEECLKEKMEGFIIFQKDMIDKFDKLEQAYEDGKDRIDEEKNNILFKIAICELGLSNIKK